jgi:hypothetical protein
VGRRDDRRRPPGRPDRPPAPIVAGMLIQAAGLAVIAAGIAHALAAA